ncbi:hypothetical protein MCOR34_000736 [Pyricularia oryzae]|uniref:Fungal lipase-type domain-containing protein n=1 Tax=Pyricularia grisea TaxID=148305 RepID=A0ABQ8NME1_PYRGI|nr:hypothetical protein MCOR33_005126 [Pyricularia grisea]KAI6326642.1 hypothetical protein MCOR34_000736 [Pyricularia oryzae]KAI6471462.1 hypothetical protein MCOR17_003169 [Pyricularia oryzae]KAI6506802.1 hypothetical protein MCOR13_003135 [Pyricularia oryzae]KAI6583651.1 hypothetical protein MCOR06_007972 [Pyricularia oryzae]
MGFFGLNRSKKTPSHTEPSLKSAAQPSLKSAAQSPPPPYTRKPMVPTTLAPGASPQPARPQTASRPPVTSHTRTATPVPLQPQHQPQLQPQWHQQLPMPGSIPGRPRSSAGTTCLTIPSSWVTSYPPSSYQFGDPRQHGHHQQPIVVNQYYLGQQLPVVHRPAYDCATANSVVNIGNSVVDMANGCLPSSLQVRHLPHHLDDGLPAWHGYGSQLLNQSAAACDRLGQRLNSVLTLIDGDQCKGNEQELFMINPQSPGTVAPPVAKAEVASKKTARPSSKSGDKASKRSSRMSSPDKNSKGQTTAIAASVMTGDYFSKVELYANSKLPMDLPPLKLYMPTWPILCLAAQYSERVYARPRGAEMDTHVDADWRTGAKAMVIKSVPMDHMNTIVFAIRGSASFMDWAVNLNTAPTSPLDFLDDPGNFCHAGFLSVARKMIAPVAARLRKLLEEDPGRSTYSLLLTGHSAGGAIAALLYAHMKNQVVNSELSNLAGCFRRIHCVTFGAPPVSLLPLAPLDSDKKSLFLSFVNEGDPVARADMAYVKSLLELFAAAAPTKSKDKDSGKSKSSSSSSSKSDKEKKRSSSSTASVSSKSSSSSDKKKSSPSKPTWKLPPSTLSNAGRIVVLRSGDPKRAKKACSDRRTVEERLNEGVVAQVVTDQQLRAVVWGDPAAHLMRLYSGRIETLAVGAVTARDH